MDINRAITEMLMAEALKPGLLPRYTLSPNTWNSGYVDGIEDVFRRLYGLGELSPILFERLVYALGIRSTQFRERLRRIQQTGNPEE